MCEADPVNCDQLSQAAIRPVPWPSVGFNQGNSPSAPIITMWNLDSDTRHIQFHVFTITLKTKTDEFYGHPLQRNQKISLFGSQCKIATFYPWYFTISRNQNRKHFFWNSTLGRRPMLFSSLYQTGTSYHPDTLNPSYDSNCYIYSTIYCLSRVAV